MGQINYREMRSGEEQRVCELVREVFNRFVAPEYEKPGIDEFFRFANPSAVQARLQAGGFILVASKSDNLVGMLEFARPDRIALLFVSLQRKGIAKQLLKRAVRRIRTAHPEVSTLTVHSSLYAEPIYRKLGFRKVGDVTTLHGITHIPMAFDLRRRDPEPS